MMTLRNSSIERPNRYGSGVGDLSITELEVQDFLHYFGSGDTTLNYVAFPWLWVCAV